MEIRCPECGYTRNVNPGSVSPDMTVATCPKCNSKFRFRSAEEKEPDFALEQEKVDTQDTMRTQEQSSPEQNTVHNTMDEQKRPVRPEDLYPPSVHQGHDSDTEPESTPKPEQDYSQEFPYTSQPEDKASNEEPLRMVYTDGKPIDDMPKDVPWAEVKELGFFPAITATIKGVLFKPELFYSIMSKDGKFTIPFSFFILVSLAAVLVDTVWQGVFGNPLIPAEALGPVSIDELFSIMFISPLILVVYLFVTGIVLHVALLLAGAASGGLGVTFRVLCYASSADLLSVIPVVGPLVGGVWKLITIVKGLKSAHNTTYARVVPPVGLLVLVLVSVVVYSLKSQGII